MKKLILSTLILFSLASVAYANGGLVFSGGKISLNSNTSFSVSETSGTIQGFSTHPPTTNQTVIDAYYDKLVAIGATWQRTDTGTAWWTVQATSSESYVWGYADLVVDRALAKGIQTVYLINNVPVWARDPGCIATAPRCAPIDSATIATFCGAVAQHFDGRVTAYEVRNEPNLSTYSYLNGQATTTYVSNLNACYDAIKAVNSNNIIISAGLSPANTVFGSSVAPDQWLTDMYALGAKFDAFGMHPYTYPTDPRCPLAQCSWSSWQKMMGTMRNTMIANGDTNKKMWLTEVGAPTCGPGTAHVMNQNTFTYGTDYMGLEAQAQIAQQYIKDLRSLPYVEHMFWYTLVDTDSTDHSDPENCFGVYYTNGTPKPVFWVIKNT